MTQNKTRIEFEKIHGFLEYSLTCVDKVPWERVKNIKGVLCVGLSSSAEKNHTPEYNVHTVLDFWQSSPQKCEGSQLERARENQFALQILHRDDERERFRNVRSMVFTVKPHTTGQTSVLRRGPRGGRSGMNPCASS